MEIVAFISELTNLMGTEIKNLKQKLEETMELNKKLEEMQKTTNEDTQKTEEMHKIELENLHDTVKKQQEQVIILLMG